MPLNRRSARESVRQLLLERILDGTYKPGDRLLEVQIASEFETSLSPVREALRDLEGLGVVESQSYKGTRVREITDREIEEAYQIRAVLEDLAAQLAAPKLKNNVAALEEHVAAFKKAARDHDFDKYSEHDMAFHRLIVQAAENQMLFSIWESVVLERRFRLTLVRIGEDELASFADAHVPILDALREGDGKKASKLARNLICTYHSRKPER